MDHARGATVWQMGTGGLKRIETAIPLVVECGLKIPVHRLEGALGCSDPDGGTKQDAYLMNQTDISAIANTPRLREPFSKIGG